MEPRKGFFYIIQFCPDHGRAEAANVGVVLFVPGDRDLRLRLDRSVKRVHQCFGRDAIGAAWFKFVRDAFERGLLRHHAESPFREPADLDRHFGKLGNQIVVTPGRPTRVEDPARDLDRLFSRLVRDDVSDGTKKARAAADADVPESVMALDAVLRRLESRNFDVQRRFSYEIPSISMPLEVDYALRNGELSLIRLLRVGGKGKKASDEALTLATKGRLVSTHRAPAEDQKAKLVVVAAPTDRVDPSATGEVDQLVSELRRDFRETQWVLSDEIAKYSAELDALEH